MSGPVREAVPAAERLLTLARLGPAALARVAAHRLGCRSGLYRRRMPERTWDGGGEFFSPATTPAPPRLPTQARNVLLARAERLLTGELDYFSSTPRKVGSPPDWFLDPFRGNRLPSTGHWSQLDEFVAGDIKNVWEASRFEWAPLLARAWRLTEDSRYLETLNGWILDWAERNPLNSGPNWKCGQEAAIRTINLLLTARLLGTHREPSASLAALVAAHCGRIRPTIGYALGQNNNHGTSEAAALFSAGAWLLRRANRATAEHAQCWRDAGRHWLEDRVAALVLPDGTFSQYSVNYHRVLTDTLCQVELWRVELGEPAFSDRYRLRARAAAAWLAELTDPCTGGAPNLGANDGARLYDLSTTPYGDYRPSAQLASVLFRGARTYAEDRSLEPLLWLGINPPEECFPSVTEPVLHPHGGDIILRRGCSRGIVRFARFRFRPSHADCLHFDLWHDGQNVLRDGGTYRYNSDPSWIEYFSGTVSHNTVQFDDRSQMPRLSRFLFGAWLEMVECSDVVHANGSTSWSGAYVDWAGARHRRTVSVAGEGGCRWTVRDEVGGFQEKAVLRWRLTPVDWTLSGLECRGTQANLRVRTSAPVRRAELATGWESLHYGERTELPVLEVEIGPGRWTLETEILLKSGSVPVESNKGG